MDTWASIQENKRKQENLRERIKRRRKGGQNLLTHATKDEATTLPSANIISKSLDNKNDEIENTQFNDEIEIKLQQYLCTRQFDFPIKIDDIAKEINKKEDITKYEISKSLVEILLQKQAVQLLLTLQREGNELVVTSIDQIKLSALIGNTKSKKQLTKIDESSTHPKHKEKDKKSRRSKEAIVSDPQNDDIEELLSIKSAKESDSKKLSDEIQELLNTSTTKEIILAKNFKSMGGSQVKEFCAHGTREECIRRRGSNNTCRKVHFKKILKPHTDESLGDCSFLNTCFHMDTCKYVHYEIDYRGTDHRRVQKRKLIESKSDLLDDEHYITRKMIPPQWINCDVRYIDMSILGKFSVIMADPPWDIHMELPYGTMQDDEMRALRIQDLADDGLMFLWVTGRAMELGRELFDIWGYKRCDELIWVKTNQLQRLIRTGRTGHWLNHGKEHCLVGIKGNPKSINRGLDCDVLVAEVRDTSHKPDEIYGIIERLSPGTRKLEIFGRMHNVQPNWVTLGNQLDGVHLTEADCVSAFKRKYPDGKVTNPNAK